MAFDPSRFRLPPPPTAADIRLETAGILTPPPDIDVAEAAERYRHLYNPGGGYSGPWRNVVVPYLVEPMQGLTDSRYDIEVFVAPAQSAKTELGLNFAAYAIEVDPSDFQAVLPEKQLAEDFSARRLARLIDQSPALAARLQERKTFAATFDRCILNLSWPSSTNASSKPVPRNWLDERDSMADDVDGEGDPVALYHKRSQTFGARRMTLVTSSPKRPPIKGAPAPAGLHEAPVTTGVLALYNQGTRRQLYWPCRHCGHYFVTRCRDLKVPAGATADDASIEVWFACPACGSLHGEADRRGLWSAHRWLAEGESIDNLGIVSGAPRLTSINSFWLFGPQAAFITLEELARKRLRAEEVRERTGSDAELRTFWNVDAGELYTPESDDEQPLAPQDLLKVAVDLPLGRVPAWAQAVVAAVDIQSNRFEIEWQAIGPDNEAAIIDIQKLVAIGPGNKPVLVGGGSGGAVAGQLEPCDPANRGEHWLALVEAVFDRQLVLEADPTKGLRPLVVVMDTGGVGGVTDKAYKFARWQRRNRPDLVRRSMFIKGRPGRNPVRVARAQWDPKTTAKRTTNRKGVDLWFVWVDELKDALASRLRRSIKGKGERGPDTLHVSRNLPAQVFDQLCAESRNEEGAWENVRRVANEAFDLAVYCAAGWIRLGGDRIDWSNPPRWARALDQAETLIGGTEPANATDAPQNTASRPSSAVTPTPPRRSRLPFGAPGRRGGSWLNGWKN